MWNSSSYFHSLLLSHCAHLFWVRRHRWITAPVRSFFVGTGSAFPTIIGNHLGCNNPLPLALPGRRLALPTKVSAANLTKGPGILARTKGFQCAKSHSADFLCTGCGARKLPPILPQAGVIGQSVSSRVVFFLEGYFFVTISNLMCGPPCALLGRSKRLPESLREVYRLQELLYLHQAERMKMLAGEKLEQTAEP